MRDVGLHRREGDEQPVGDLVVGQPSRHGLEDFFFTVGERLDRLRHLARLDLREMAQQAHRDRRRHQGVAPSGSLDRLDQELRAGVLEQESGRTVAEGGPHVLVEIEGGDHHHRCRIVDVGPRQYTGRLQSVHDGHADVEQRHVGTESARLLDGSPAVSGFSRDLDAVRLQDQLEPGPDHLLVVGHQHPQGPIRRHRSIGIHAVTDQPRPGLCPPQTVLPSAATRSAIPVSPKPRSPECSWCRPSSTTLTWMPSSWRRTAISTRETSTPCRPMLVRLSWMIRKIDDSNEAGTPSRSIWRSTRYPSLFAASLASSSRSSRPEPGARGSSPSLSRRAPTSRRMAFIVAMPLTSIFANACCTASGSLAPTACAAWAWTTMPVTWWATV